MIYFKMARNIPQRAEKNYKKSPVRMPGILAKDQTWYLLKSSTSAKLNGCSTGITHQTQTE
jgi:hypothetical protein